MLHFNFDSPSALVCSDLELRRKLHVPSLPSQTVPSPASASRLQVLTVLNLELKEPQLCAISENIRILIFQTRHHSGAATLCNVTVLDYFMSTNGIYCLNSIFSSICDTEYTFF